ncbi:hypothetical protein EDC54_10468 [Samsonia erythrinae]|uniref:Uncharacterized protein n=1 Tax=Samsonia erythrinae TaxID=160434 RepID=A0A4V2VTD6_9GAMM|nr:hypothetical protein EDC54_10468 [Samsonia erythrinae]
MTVKVKNQSVEYVSSEYEAFEAIFHGKLCFQYYLKIAAGIIFLHLNGDI